MPPAVAEVVPAAAPLIRIARLALLSAVPVIAGRRLASVAPLAGAVMTGAAGATVSMAKALVFEGADATPKAEATA